MLGIGDKQSTQTGENPRRGRGADLRLSPVAVPFENADLRLATQPLAVITEGQQRLTIRYPAYLPLHIYTLSARRLPWCV